MQLIPPKINQRNMIDSYGNNLNRSGLSLPVVSFVAYIYILKC